MNKSYLKSKLIVLSMLVCLSSCSVFFPKSTELSGLKDNYSVYVDNRSNNESLDALTESRSNILAIADDIIKKSPKDSKAYGQAFLIKVLVEQDFTGKIPPSLDLIEFVKVSHLDTEPSWFRSSVYVLLANSLAKENKFISAKPFYEKVLVDKSASVPVRAYALSSYVEAILNNIKEPNMLETYLDKAESSARVLQMEDPLNSTVELLIAEINSQIGDDVDACSYAKAAIAQGLKDQKQLNSAKFIQKTSCTNSDSE